MTFIDRFRVPFKGTDINLHSVNDVVRPLTTEERQLARWMLENGISQASDFLPQLDCAQATSWRCKCGCASFNFRIAELPPAPPGVHILADFVYGDGDANGVFIFENAGLLSGVEVVGYAGDAPSVLPNRAELRPLSGLLSK